MNQALKIFLAIFASYRISSLIAKDEGPYLGNYCGSAHGQYQTGIFEQIRIKAGVYDYGPNGLPESNLARGISCPLCVGIYISILLTALLLFPSRVGRFFLIWMGISGAQVFLENLTSDESISEAITEVAESVE